LAIQDPASKDSLPRDEMLTRFRNARERIQGRLEVLAALLDVPAGPRADEFHASVRVKDLAKATRLGLDELPACLHRRLRPERGGLCFSPRRVRAARSGIELGEAARRQAIDHVGHARLAGGAPGLERRCERLIDRIGLSLEARQAAFERGARGGWAWGHRTNR
jgi:hypothetical protein